MTRSRLLALVVATLLPTLVVAEEPAAAVPETPPAAEEKPPEASAETPPEKADPKVDEDAIDHSIDRHRNPVEVLTERMIGTASRAVRYDWRRSTVGFAFQFSELLERNNFGSTRIGGHVRTPFGNLIGELGVNWVFLRETESTRKLALTPYRQAGRPSRLELDFNVLFPVAEGVATAWPGFFPATELVFSAIGGLRYAYYPGSFRGATVYETATGLLSLNLDELELGNLEKDRPGGMLIDPSRYALLAGLALDLHFASGGFISPRAMAAIPVFSLGNDSELGVWWELSIAAGWAF